LILGVVLLVRESLGQSRQSWNRVVFVSGFSHQLKTPLANVRLYTELLQDGGTLGDQERRCCDVIIGEVEKLRRRIDKVLSSTRIDRRRAAYDLREDDLVSLVVGTVDTYRHWVSRNGCSVCVSTEPLPTIRLDSDAISEAVVNLIENAVQHSGGGRQIEVRVWSDGPRAFVDVQDDGVGIAREDQQRIFEQFYRVPGQSGQTGFGLGLFLVRHTMRAHGGDIEVTSTVGQGSRFRLIFPVCGRY
jgi:two-component system phosphate regulon sensor histidine kinase PhoR